MTKAYDLAVGSVVDTTNFVTKSNGAIEALDGSALTSLTPANLDNTGTIPSQLLAGVGGGKLKQIQWAEYTHDTSIGSATFTDLSDGTNTFEISITPTASDSKILIEYTIQAYVGAGDGYTTQLVKTVNGVETPLYGPNDPSDIYDRGSGRDTIQYLVTAGTTAEITYKIKVKTVSGNSVGFSANNSPCIFTVMEIAA